MTFYRQPSNDDAADRSELTALERELERLPPPPIPPGLEARLLADIPVAPPAAPRRIAVTQRRWLYAAAAAAVMLFALTLLVRSRDADVSELLVDSAHSSAGALSGRGADPKETDPCNVLPAWPNWR
jgi:hypothetical protein